MYDSYGYNPMMAAQQPQSNPYMERLRQYQQPQRMQPYDSVTRVTGIEGAKAYQMPPNSRAALFSDADDMFFIKTTDGAGFPTYQAYGFHKIDMATLVPAQQAPVDYITRTEFNTLNDSVTSMNEAIGELKELMTNGKQSVRKSAKASTDADE